MYVAFIDLGEGDCWSVRGVGVVLKKCPSVRFSISWIPMILYHKASIGVGEFGTVIKNSKAFSYGYEFEACSTKFPS